MADDMNVLFIRGNGNVCMDTDTANDNVWDDGALIEAYDKAINLAKEEVIKRMGMDVGNSQPKENLQNLKQPKHASKLHKKWIIGAPYRAIYSEDGEIYEAIISKMYENNGTCVVKFVGYGNTEKVELSSLLESEGLQSQIAQQKKALEEKFNEENDETCETNFSTNVNSKKYNVEKMDCGKMDILNIIKPSISYFKSVSGVPAVNTFKLLSTTYSVWLDKSLLILSSYIDNRTIFRYFEHNIVMFK
ncbi:survival motor neuron protein-like [Bombus bifarius]|uniref:Survival motor neuron protein-like n=2 Tax=Pyrobombus TaxID=144703 RepID=A0A6P8N1T3_9HYME|nr:survival motor neuron protein-like [Bombus bifarius]